MARGRFLSKGISQSDQVAALPTDTARLIFTWMIAHADGMGRLPADPKKIKGVVLTLLDVDLKAVEEALLAMQAGKLIELYEVSGVRYLQFTGWERHQKIRQEREGTPWPGPNEGSASIGAHTSYDAQAGGNDASETEVEASSTGDAALGTISREYSRTSTSTSASASASASESSTSSTTAASGSSGVRSPRRSEPASKVALDDVTTLLGLFNTHRGKLPQAVELTKFRRARLETLLRDHGLEKASEYMVSATRACANDAWWVEKGYGIDNLLRDDRVVARAESYSAKKQGTSIRGDLQAAAARNGWELP